MVTRNPYVEKVRPFYNSDLIKIITGIRRCGKSVILEQVMADACAKSKNVIYINFEDMRISSKIKNGMELLEYIKIAKRGRKRKFYLFFDEIQTLDGWQNACKTLRLSGDSLFITGSNSKLLSKEFTKELSGRYVSFRIRPFVYKELLQYAKQLKKKVTADDYLIWGGFPKRLEFNSLGAQTAYISELYETIILNDLIARYKIRKTEIFKSIVNYVLKSNSRIFSSHSIYTYIKNEKISASENTIVKYLDYLKEAYVIEGIPQFSKKTKRTLRFFEKIYNADVAFNSLLQTDNRFDLTHNFENVVYNELLYMGYELCVYDNGGKEIDFLATKNGRKYFIQVAFSVADEKSYEREFDAFKNIDNLNQKVLITNDNFDFSTSTIRHIKFKDFILMNEL